MTENEFILQDRLTKIRNTIEKYGEDNFFLCFSGGKDSTILSELIDMAIPNNKIPRVFADTGIELNMIREFVFNKTKHDERFVIIKPSTPIKKMLDEDGYPFKSKMHSHYVNMYQKKGLEYKSVRAYVGIENTLKGLPMFRPCPKILQYQFTDENALKISDKCCLNLKEKPTQKWQKENGKHYAIVGIKRDDGGRRYNSQCLVFAGGKLKSFQPLVIVSNEWEEWYIKTYNVDICAIYNPPYNFERTGCKGCPFALHLQQELDTLEKFFPEERRQCEIIWRPVYGEYRRINYRLKGRG